MKVSIPIDEKVPEIPDIPVVEIAPKHFIAHPRVKWIFRVILLVQLILVNFLLTYASIKFSESLVHCMDSDRLGAALSRTLSLCTHFSNLYCICWQHLALLLESVQTTSGLSLLPFERELVIVTQ